MKGRPSASPVPAGPLRWGFRSYTVAQHATPFGHRYEAIGPGKETIAFTRMKRGEADFVFFSDDSEKEELFRLHPKPVRLYAVSYDAVDSRSGTTFGEIRRRDYSALSKSEWFLFNPEGEIIGMVAETAPTPSLLRRLVPLDVFFRKSWQFHWGQQICGSIRPEASLLGDRLVLDLGLDTKDAVDRRLALAVTVTISHELHGGAKAQA